MSLSWKGKAAPLSNSVSVFPTSSPPSVSVSFPLILSHSTRKSEKNRSVSFLSHQGLIKKREVGEFLSGAFAGAMAKAVLAPLETIRQDCFLFYFPGIKCLLTYFIKQLV